MDRRVEAPKFNIAEGQKFDACILAGGKVIDRYLVLIKEIRTREIELMELCNPPRFLTVRKKEFMTGKIGIMEFNPLPEKDMV